MVRAMLAERGWTDEIEWRARRLINMATIAVMDSDRQDAKMRQIRQLARWQ